jgi:hypothetical protein
MFGLSLLIPGASMNIRPLTTAVTVPLKKLWQLLLQVWLYLKSRTQLVFNFMMDQIVVWLCRYYQPSFEMG